MPLSWILHIFIGATLSGVALVVTLVAGGDSLIQLIAAAIIGCLVALPLSRLIARQLGDQ